MNFQCEIHNFCNFECGYCPNYIMKRKRQFMDDNVWMTILEKFIIPYRHINSFSPPTFIPHKDTEPLLDRKLISKLKLIPSDMKIDIYSNGVLLPKWQSRGEDFINFLASIPNQCRFLLSYHPYNYDNSPNDYSQVIEYLRDVLKSPPSNVEFITSSHRSKWVSDELQKSWQQAWIGLPITVHCNTNLTPWAGFTVETATCKYNGCPYSDFGHWFFGVTGNVIACCLDLEEEIVIGNVMTDSPAHLFDKTSIFYANQKYIHSQNKRPTHAVCDNCYGYNRNDRNQELLTLGVKTV